MQAIRVHQFGGPEECRLEEVERPRPGPGQVLVRLQAVGVNPVDTYLRAGIYPRLPSLPYTPGRDGAGVVETVLEEGSLWPGQSVYVAGSITGTYAQFCLAHREQVFPLPPGVG